MNINAIQKNNFDLNRVIESESISSEGANLRAKVTYGLLLAYAFLSPLGNLTRFEFRDEGSTLGLTSLFLILAVGINLFQCILILRTSRILFSLVILVLWMGFSSLFSSDILGAYLRLSNFALYVLLACLAFSIHWSVRNIHRLLMGFILGGFLCATLTLIDWFGLINIPRVNELMVSTGTDLGAISRASGPFTRRSAMAAFFSLLIPIATLAFLHIKQLLRKTKVFAFVTAITTAIALFLTHNRAGLLGALLAIVVINIFLAYSKRKLMRMMIKGIILIVFFIWLVMTYFPEHLIVYKAKLHIGDVSSTDIRLQESDDLRMELFKHVIRSLTVNPIGNGYTLVTDVSNYYDYDEIDPHNNITQIIWAAGIFGIGWLVYFGVSMFNSTKVIFSKIYLNNPINQYGTVIVGSLLGWFFYGQAHTVFGTGMAWLLFGVLLKIIKIDSQEGKLQN